MDMVVGVDIHFEMVPTPAGPIPTPFPNPFIGVVLDPAGLATGLAVAAALSLATGGTPTGPVLINNMPATNVGTEAKGMGHILIPPGVSWVPMPKFPKPSFRGPPEFPGLPVKPEDDAVSIMGSTTVTIMGSSAVRMGEVWMSCGEPLRLPSSAVIAIPKGPLVLVGGPPGVNLLDALLAMIKTKWVAGYLHSLLSRVKSDRLRNILSKAVCFFTGHPVDVANGRMLTDNVDFELPGPLPLKFERTYVSSWSHRSGPLGPGWSHSCDQAIWFERGKVVYLAEDGREIEFDVFDLPEHSLRPGQQVYDPINRLTLRFQRSNLIEIETHDGETIEFAQLRTATSGPRAHWWRMQRRRSRDRHEIAFTYDARGNLEWIRDCGGRVAQFEHDKDNRLTCVRLPHPVGDGHVEYLRYAYDSEGDLVRATDAHGASWTYAYQRHLMVRETDRAGLSFYFAYDGWGHDACCVRTWGDGGIYDHVIDYAKGQQTVVTNSLGHRTGYKLNAIGLVVEILDAFGGTQKFEYDERTLQKLKQTDQVGGVTTWEYDDRGNCTKTVGPTGATTAVAYNGMNLPTQATDESGGTWKWTYDSLGHVVSLADPAGQVETYSWRDGLLVIVAHGGAQPMRLEWDSSKNPSLMERGDYRATFEHDRLGRLTRSIEQGRSTRYTSDILGRLVTQSSATGMLLQLTYDPEGKLTRHRSPNHDMEFTYTCRDRVASRRGYGLDFKFQYDTEGQLIGVTNAAGEQLRVELDPAGQVLSETGFDGQIRRYQRDAAGRITRVHMPSGRWAKLTHDAEDRVTEVTHSDGTWVKYQYDPGGALVAAENEGGKLSLSWDFGARTFRESFSSAHTERWVESGLGWDGQRSSLKTSLGTQVDVQRDQRGLLARVDIGSTNSARTRRAIHFQQDVLGASLAIGFPGRVGESWSYDSEGRASARHVDGPNPLRVLHSSLQWRGEDQIAAIVTSEGSTNFQHDAAGRLTHAQYPDGSSVVRTFDGAGNVHSNDARQYGPGGRIKEAQGRSYRHDADGLLVEKRMPDGALWQYAWFASGLLREVRRPDDVLVQFEYDALGRRTRKRVLRSEQGAGDVLIEDRAFVWDGQQLLHEVSTETGLTTWHWQPESLRPIAKEQNGNYFSITADHLGSPREMHDEKGQLVWQNQLDPLGRPRDGEGNLAECPWRWPGQYHDAETGLYANGARYYDPADGQYLTPDPLGLTSDAAPYAYVEDPLSWIDPLGLAGYMHPAGVWVTGGGNPVFPSSYNCRLPPSMRAANVSDIRQMGHATRELRDAIAKGKVDGSIFSRRQLKAIKAGKPRIPGLTWHHHPNGSMMQLVNRKLHASVGHDGGRKKVGGRC